MIISVKRTGGFAGLTEELGTVNTMQLNAATAQQIEQMVLNIDFFNLPAFVESGIGADLFRYEITIRDGDRRHVVAFNDDGGPETAPLRQLVEAIMQL
jgi:hypothetical protein